MVDGSAHLRPVRRRGLAVLLAAARSVHVHLLDACMQAASTCGHVALPACNKFYVCTLTYISIDLPDPLKLLLVLTLELGEDASAHRFALLRALCCCEPGSHFSRLRRVCVLGSFPARRNGALLHGTSSMCCARRRWASGERSFRMRPNLQHYSSVRMQCNIGLHRGRCGLLCTRAIGQGQQGTFENSHETCLLYRFDW